MFRLLLLFRLLLTLLLTFVGYSFRHLAKISSLLTNGNFHLGLTFVTLTLNFVKKKSDFFVFWVINYIQKIPENHTFYSPKSIHYGLAKATKKFFMSSVRGRTKYTNISNF